MKWTELVSVWLFRFQHLPDETIQLAHLRGRVTCLLKAHDAFFIEHQNSRIKRQIVFIEELAVLVKGNGISQIPLFDFQLDFVPVVFGIARFTVSPGD